MSEPQKSGETQSFHGLGIAPKLLEILARHKYVTPTPIQQKSIPVSIEGKDMIGIAQTGTGKTLAFGVPMLQRQAASSRSRSTNSSIRSARTWASARRS